MNWRLFDYDEATGIKTWFAHDPEAKKNVFRYEQDVEDILANNHALANHDDKGWSKTKEWRRVAEIPLTVVMDWQTKYGVDVFKTDNQKLFRRLLNDIDYRKFRTAPGRV